MSLVAACGRMGPNCVPHSAISAASQAGRESESESAVFPESIPQGSPLRSGSSRLSCSDALTRLTGLNVEVVLLVAGCQTDHSHCGHALSHHEQHGAFLGPSAHRQVIEQSVHLQDRRGVEPVHRMQWDGARVGERQR